MALYICFGQNSIGCSATQELIGHPCTSLEEAKQIGKDHANSELIKYSVIHIYRADTKLKKYVPVYHGIIGFVGTKGQYTWQVKTS